MNLFLKKIFLFSLIYLGLCRIISICVPYHWGNPWHSVKISYLENNKPQGFNTYFFGSSRVYRQINPALFDSLTHQFTGEEIRSFNLGAPGTFVPQSYYLYERFLDSELSIGVKYCFLELGNIGAIKADQMHQEPTNYWLGFSNLRFVLRSIFLDNSQTTAHKMTQSSRYLVSYLENVLHLGHFGQQIKTANYYDEAYLGPFYNGFLPLEYELKTAQYPAPKEVISSRRRNFEKAPEGLEVRKNLVHQAYNDHSNTFYDKVNEQRLLALIEKSRKKGIELIIIFISHNPQENYKTLINLSRKLPEANVINMTHPAKYPDFFESENAFDIGHLNSKGSGLFTTHLAKEFREIEAGR